MKIVIKKPSVYDLLGWVALTLYVITSLLFISFYVRQIPIFAFKGSYLIINLIILFRDFFFNKQTIRSFTGLLIAFVLGLIVARISGVTSSLVSGIILIYGTRNDELKKNAYIVYLATLVVFAFVIFSSKIGIIQDYVEVSSTRIRHYLGFRYSLYPSTIMFNIVLMKLFIKEMKITFWEVSILLISTIWIYRETNSRLAFYSSLLAIIVITTFKVFPNLLSKIRPLLFPLSFSYVISVVLSWLVIKNFNPFSPFWSMLNNFLGNRINLSRISIELYGFKWFGQPINWVGNGLDTEGYRNNLSYLFVDNMYFNIAQKYGLLFIIVLVFILTATALKAYFSGNYILLIILILLSFHAVIDNLMLELHYNFFWLAVGPALISTNIKRPLNRIKREY